MASSKVVTTNTDLPRQSSICSLSSIIADLQHHANNNNNDDPNKTLPSMSSMDDLIKSFYSSSSEPNNHDPTHLHPDPNLGDPKEEMSAKTVDEVWKEMVVGGGDQRRVGGGEGLEGMTLEDFLNKAGAVPENGVRGVPNVVAGPGSFHVDPAAINGAAAQFPMPAHGMEPSVEAFGNGIDGAVVRVAAPGRGKRRVMEEPVDKATLQKQRRMIKNRESAARSRERKQAYTVELETLVTQLEEENARLLKEQADLKKQRLKQLMEHLIPVVEKRKPQPMLRRVNSAQCFNDPLYVTECLFVLSELLKLLATVGQNNN
ncbi:hypothetical protein L6164_036258 [Bauhinia variegata]|uniref:Uncharacterized protein n=1 Tax=Bauhinia variegata TaxID=167791 RepID=A0ACB9KGD5_BAUVA|nr:hypothetical protein L6164_036258 [Bauhinia variegata]